SFPASRVGPPSCSRSSAVFFVPDQEIAMLWKSNSPYPDGPSTVNPAGASLPSPEALHPPRTLTGRKLARIAKKGPHKERGRLAYDLATGKVVVVGQTLGQAADDAAVSRSYVAAYARFSPDEQADFDTGKASLRQIRQRQATSDSAVDRFIKKHGLAAVWA